MTAHVCGIFFEGDGNIRELDGGDGCTTPWT